MRSRNRQTVAAALADGRRRLKLRFPDEYKIDALVLLCHVLEKDKEFLFANGDYILTESELRAYNQCLGNRIDGMPVAYIVGRCEFMRLSFSVDSRVLIPRSDSEILAEQAIKHARSIDAPRILDICTGSGCLAISVARFVKDAQVLALDISPDALALAQQNAEALGVSDQITFLESDLFSAMDAPRYADAFDLVISNPPYIPHVEMGALMLSVRNFEPHLALDGGSRGLEFYQRITADVGRYLKNGGMLFFEIGYNQAEEVSAFMQSNDFYNIQLVKDYADFDRVLGGMKCSTD